MKVVVDASEVTATTARFEQFEDALPSHMMAVAAAAAEAMRGDREYQNRTGDLEASTYADFISGGASPGSSEVGVEIGAREEYASYVEARGLAHFTEIAEDTEAYFDEIMDTGADSFLHGGGSSGRLNR